MPLVARRNLKKCQTVSEGIILQKCKAVKMIIDCGSGNIRKQFIFLKNRAFKYTTLKQKSKHIQIRLN